jgi:catechol 2,3-dioxygenase-like lactoylglutathione lyase family enzyme
MLLNGLHHVYLKVQDLDRTRPFVEDFGLTKVAEFNGRVFYRSGGTAAYNLVVEASEQSSLGALAFELDPVVELEQAQAEVGGDIVLLDGPGGGRALRLLDPEGTQVQLVSGIEKRDPDPVLPLMTTNQGAGKPRQGIWQHKPPLGAPPLLRLGHVGLYIKDWRACDSWYRETLGLIPSDLLYVGTPDNVIGGFYRIDRGDEWVDHHVIALFAMGKSDLHHLSFEVPNPETQFMGHRWMVQRQHESIWGVGRHPLGSHVFDVWRDPSGYGFETFSDTDLCNATIPTVSHSVLDTSMDLWSDRDSAAYFS